jgi:hypothetical protein
MELGCLNLQKTYQSMIFLDQFLIHLYIYIYIFIFKKNMLMLHVIVLC